MKNKMRILLIKASYYYYHNRGVSPPLGLMYLASFLREKEKDVKIKIIDTRVECQKEGKIKEKIIEFKPDIVGISAITVEAKKMHSIAKEVKEVSRNIPVIVGGPHPTSYPEEVMTDENIDYAVIREGEKTFLEIVRCLSSGKKPSRIKGIYMRENGKLIFTGEPDFIENLDELPFPAWDLVHPENYFKEFRFTPVGHKIPYIGVITSRACPYRCIYCHNMFGKIPRLRSPLNVADEIEEITKRIGVNEVEVFDDIFNINEERVVNIFEEIMRRNLKLRFSFPNGLRSDRLSRKTLEVMRKGGTYYISFAIETGSPRLQKFIKKNLDLDKAKKAIEDAVSLGIFSNGFFMLGFPTETEEEMKMTVDFALNSPLHTAMFFIVIPHKGTELFNMCEKNDEREAQAFDYFRRWKFLDPLIKRVYRNAYIKFYADPKRIWRIWKDYPFRRTELFSRLFYTISKFV